MAKQILPVDFQDDLINVSMGEKRRYRMINNSDGTVSLEDVTVYDRIGSNFGAGQINATNQAVNESFDKNKLIRDLDTINALTEEGYAVDALSVKQITNSLQNENNESFNFGYKDGVRGFFTNPSRADDSFIPFKQLQFQGMYMRTKTYELEKGEYIISNFTYATSSATNAIKYSTISEVTNGTFELLDQQNAYNASVYLASSVYKVVITENTGIVTNVDVPCITISK